MTQVEIVAPRKCNRYDAVSSAGNKTQALLEKVIKCSEFKIYTQTSLPLTICNFVLIDSEARKYLDTKEAGTINVTNAKTFVSKLHGINKHDRKRIIAVRYNLRPSSN